MRFLGRPPRPQPLPYAIHPPYAEARAELLAHRPAPGTIRRVVPWGRLFGVVVDVGLDEYLVSVYLLDDGTISIYSTAGIHSTGLRGAARVADAARAIVEETDAALDGFTRVEDGAALPLPERGHSRVLARTYDGDLVATDAAESTQRAVAELSAMAIILTRLARAALVEGFDRVETGEVRYQLSPDYRRLRSTLMDWLPPLDELPPGARLASLVVETGDAATATVTSLFAFADGSASVYRSDGAVAKGLGDLPDTAASVRSLLGAAESAMASFGPAGLIAPPQPGRVQLVVRALAADGDWTELVAVADRSDLEAGSHPLSAAWERALPLLRSAAV